MALHEYDDDQPCESAGAPGSAHECQFETCSARDDSPTRTTPQKRRFRFWTHTHRLTAFLFLAVVSLGQLDGLSWFEGAATSAEWFGLVPFFDPLAASEVLVATGRVTLTMLLGLVLTVGTALVLGRVFCGWVCPLGLLLELAEALRQFLRLRFRKVFRRLPRWSLPRSLKYWLLASCLAWSVLSALPVFTMVSPINLTAVGLVRFPLVLLGMLSLLTALETFFPRGFCRAICPLGALYAILGRVAPLRVRVTGPERLRCQQCSLACPMGIDVMRQFVLADRPTVDDPECTRCGTCTDVCPATTLRLGFRNPACDVPPDVVDIA